MSRIAVLHPQCVRVGGAIQMALQTTRALQQQGHTVTLYTFEKSEECFPELQADLDIFVWNGRIKKEKIKNKKGGFFIINKSVSFIFSLLFFLSPKAFNIITLAFHLRQFDIIIANNPPMQIVAALAKVFSLRFKRKNKKEKIKKEDDKKDHNYSLSSLTTIWWHHHVPWYLGPKTKIKSFIERYLIVPFIDQMIATSHFVAEKIEEYCGREAVVVHPVIQIQSQSPFQGGADEGSGGMQQHPGSLQSEEGEGMHQKSGHGEYTYPANTKLQSFSHQMSREMTRAEQRLWFEVLQSGKTGYKWVKQKIIGNFIVDFYCHEKRLVIEVDGGVHQDQEYYDMERTKYLEKLGIRVIRYTNELVLNQIDQVREKILWEMEQMQDPNYQPNLSSPLKGALDADTETVTAPVPLSRGEESQNEQGGMQPDTIPLSSTKISSPLKGALDADTETVTAPVPLSRGEESENERGGMVTGTGIESAASAPFKGLLTSVERWGMVKGTGSSNTDTVTLFTHGRLEAGKGIDVLVKTFQRMNNEEMKKMKNGGIVSDSPLQISPEIGEGAGGVRLIIFGTGSLESKLREQGIDVRPFEGQKTFSALSTGEYGHVIGVYCSSIDAFGMASLESQMAGFPTIIMDRGGAREAILSDDHDEPVGYLVHTEEDLLGAISRYVQKKTSEKQLSNVNFSHKRDYFSPARLSSDLLSIITKTGQ